MSDIKHLLPPSASTTERAIETVIAERTVGIAAPIADLWNVDTCPVDLLPWMAWAFSVEVWDHAWPEDVKRAVIRGSVQVHRLKGTKGAVVQALASLGVEGNVSEWFEYGGDPYTFRIDALIEEVFEAGFNVNLQLANEIDRVIRNVKPVRAYYDLRLGERLDVSTYARTGYRQTSKDTTPRDATPPSFEIVATARAATGMRERAFDRAQYTPIERSAA
jgi:phage tail P2-like protein